MLDNFESSYNMPPGVYSIDIPGNRNIDIAWENFIESNRLDEICGNCDFAEKETNTCLRFHHKIEKDTQINCPIVESYFDEEWTEW